MPATTLIKAIDHVERVTSNPSQIRDLPLHIRLDLPIDVLKPIETSVLIGHGRTHPRLRVAHVPPETLALLKVLQLPQRPAQWVHRVRYLLRAVTQRLTLSLAVAGRDMGQVSGHSAGPGEADLDGGSGQVARGLAGGGARVGREGTEAKVGVAGMDARWTDDVIWGRIGFSCSGGVGGGEEEE